MLEALVVAKFVRLRVKACCADTRNDGEAKGRHAGGAGLLQKIGEAAELRKGTSSQYELKCKPSAVIQT